jgi:class 3 adenylate cyclase
MAGDPPPYRAENRTVICTVVFVDLVDYSREPVSRQAALKRHLNDLIGRALAHVAETDRIALDTGDGAALCFFGDPEDALFAAFNLRQAVTAEPGPGAQIRIGINLGPTRIVRDVNGNRNIIGDGINVAQRVMSFAAPNQILVSRSYYEIVSRVSEEYARLFQYAGLHRDKHVREHEVYEVHGGAGAGPQPGGDAAPAAAAPPPAFSADFLETVTRALTGHLGPVAKLIVHRASLRARDPQQLLAVAADTLTGPARTAFLSETSRLAAPAASAAPRTVSPPEAAPARGPREPRRLTPEVLAAAERHLARHVGPIARLLVAQAAREVTDTHALAERLAGQIDDSAARRAFLAAMEG